MYVLMRVCGIAYALRRIYEYLCAYRHYSSFAGCSQLRWKSPSSKARRFAPSAAFGVKSRRQSRASTACSEQRLRTKSSLQISCSSGHGYRYASVCLSVCLSVLFSSRQKRSLVCHVHAFQTCPEKFHQLLCSSAHARTYTCAYTTITITVSNIIRTHAYVNTYTYTHQVHPERFYNPVTSLLTASEGADGWKRMKTVGELRRESKKPYHVNKDSLYKPIERPPRKFNPLKVPACLGASRMYPDQYACGHTLVCVWVCVCVCVCFRE